MSDINAILKRPENKACGVRGASMGRSSQTEGEPERLRLQRMYLVDGDYDTGGAYWGGGAGLAFMWCAFSPEKTNNDPPIEVFVRGWNREEAKKEVLKALWKAKGWTFFK